MASGIKVNDECKIEFQNLKMGKQYKYLIFGLSNDMKEIIVTKKASPEAEYSEMVTDLRKIRDQGQCCYVVYSAKYTTGEMQMARGKIMFVMWTPSEASVKQKMVYASSAIAFKRELGQGIGMSITSGDDDEIAWEEVLCKLREGDKYY